MFKWLIVLLLFHSVCVNKWKDVDIVTFYSLQFNWMLTVMDEVPFRSPWIRLNCENEYWLWCLHFVCCYILVTSYWSQMCLHGKIVCIFCFSFLSSLTSISCPSTNYGIKEFKESNVLNKTKLEEPTLALDTTCVAEMLDCASNSWQFPIKYFENYKNVEKRLLNWLLSNYFNNLITNI